MLIKGDSDKSKQDLHSYLQVGGEGVREPHIPGEGTEDQVTQLDAVRRNDITEAVVVVTQEFWEVMKQDQEDPQSTLEQSNRTNKHQRYTELVCHFAQH